jgi:molybdenum cofactor cytidylyltransferase
MTESALEGLPDLTIVHNPQWASGMLSSIQQGIRALPEDVSGSIIHHGDMPFIGSLAIETMIQAIRIEVEQAHSNLALPLASACSSVHGHPVYVPARFFPDILGLDVQNTLWDFLVHKGCKLVETGSSAVLEDIDTPDDYRSLVSKYIYKEEIVEDLF